MRVLRARDHRRMPWKNGGGETTEIAVFPDDAGLSDFDWRVSMARVDRDGPFSAFPGIDRTLAILDGDGIVLDVEGHEPRRLAPGGAAHAFPADVPTSAALIGGAVVDFNVMSRRCKIAHSLLPLSGSFSSAAGASRLLFCARSALRVDVDGETVRLGAHDALRLDPAEHARIAGENGGHGYLVTFLPEAVSVRD